MDASKVRPLPGQGRRWRRAGSIAAIAGGLTLLIAGVTVLGQHATTPAPYQYVIGDALPQADVGPLAPYAAAGRTLRRAAVVPPGQDTPLAELAVADSALGPVLVSWQAKLDDPFLTLVPPADEVAALAPVLERHVASGSSVLAWWDVSRQLALLSSTPVAFDRHLGTPLFVPSRWQGMRESIESVEREFWRMPDAAQAPEAQEATQRFQRFVDALVSEESEGIAALKALTDGKPAVLVLHVRDAILLGQLAPRRMGVAFRDFGGMTDVHGMVRRVHDWLDHNRYPAYATLRAGEKSVRAVALTDAPSAATLAARLLPFVGNDQHDVSGATLVYRVGGFVVYEIAAAGA